MTENLSPESRVHDLLAVAFGAFAAITLISSGWNVDSEGPDPFFKGPLIFPLLVLGMMILASLPACLRMIRPPAGSSWRLDGEGFPKKTLLVLILLCLALVGIEYIGIEISALAFIMIGLRLAGHRGPVRTVLVPIIVTGLVVLVFKYFLDVFFPTPLLVEWFME